MDKSQAETVTLSESSPVSLQETTLPQPSNAIGQVLGERYLVERALGQGGVGAVYLARDQKLHGKPVVIKVLLERSLQNAWVVQKFQQEKEALARVDHPGVVGILDTGELSDGKPYIVMQHIDGVTLRSEVKPDGISFDRAAEFVRQIGRALTSAHDKGILHRDLKPENIMLQTYATGEEQVKIIDFGIAKLKDSVAGPSTVTSATAGTVSYMAPEQLSGRALSAATDIYAMGTIAFELLTGKKPFNPQTGFDLLELQRAGVPMKPIELRPALPETAQSILLKALSFDPAARYSAAREFGEALATALTANADSVEDAKSTYELLPTQLAPELQVVDGVSQKTIAVSFPMAPASLSTLGRAHEESAQTVRRSKSRLFVVLASILMLLGGFVGVWYGLIKKNQTHSPVATAAADSTPRILNYSLTVQKMRDGRPYQDQFESSGQEIFENGWKFAMNLTSPESGYLYLLNEGPASDGNTSFNILFPNASNAGAAYLEANKNLTTAWMVFDEHQGTEKFWVVWAANPVSELEAVRSFVTQEHKGTVADPVRAKAVATFLNARYSSSTPNVEKDKTKKQTVVKATGDVLVNVIELEHH